MAQVTRIVGYSNSYQELVVPDSITGQVTAYLWGGGGGGGGGPDGRSGSSGAGGGGGYADVSFNVNTGDVIGIAVGGPGIVGSYGGGAPGGAGGAGYIDGLSWSSLNMLNLPGTTRYQNSAYCSFLNSYGIWNSDISSTYFDRTQSVYFPTSGQYTIVGSCDNYGYVYIDGSQVLAIPDFHYTVSSTTYVTQGYHDVRLYGINTGGPGSIGVTIEPINVYAGSLLNAPPPVAAIVPGTSGYYVYRFSDGETSTVLQYTIVVAGVITYQSGVAPPPSVGYPGAFVGISYDYYETSFNRYTVEVYDLYVPGFSAYSGGQGGRSGPSGASGAGGGGGGATVLTLNGNIIAVAGGGGGGGGAGQFSFIAQCNAPGLDTQAPGLHAGQNGEPYGGDGGGGGAGGGGWNSGNGGATRGGETTAYAGSYGTSYTIAGNSSNAGGQAPANSSSPYLGGGVTARGGKAGIPGVGYPTSGGPGQATFLFNQHALSIKNGGNWTPIQNVYIKSGGGWKQTKSAWIKKDGVWVPFYGSNNNVPDFTTVAGRFGTLPRPFY